MNIREMNSLSIRTLDFRLWPRFSVKREREEEGPNQHELNQIRNKNVDKNEGKGSIQCTMCNKG